MMSVNASADNAGIVAASSGARTRTRTRTRAKPQNKYRERYGLVLKIIEMILDGYDTPHMLQYATFIPHNHLKPYLQHLVRSGILESQQIKQFRHPKSFTTKYTVTEKGRRLGGLLLSLMELLPSK